MPLHEDEHVYRSYVANLKNLALTRAIKTSRYWRLVGEVVDQSEALKAKSDEDLKSLAQTYHEQVINGRSVDRMLVPYFALVRESSRRVLEMSHFPVQILAGIAMHHGHIVEVATGEGKTLLATLPVALNALTDRGVHVVTVNDYLAKRDAEWMGKLYSFLGLTTGVLTHESSPEERTIAYRSAITYATNKEVGFDFLRDELRGKSQSWFSFGKGIEQLAVQQVQRPDFHYAIVDEADSILIDEARTPLIIASAPPVDDEVADEFLAANEMALELAEDIDYTYERAERLVEWTATGEQHVSRRLGGRRSLSGHRIDWHEAALRALKGHLLFHRDVDYVIDDGEVVIVDEFTGRKMPGRQWEEGLHQAVAAKEGLEIKGQTEVFARTTYQILFNRYEKLSGMTGTVLPETREFAEVYGMGTLRIPTNRRCIRRHLQDQVYGTEDAKWNAVVGQVQALIDQNRSVLIGTRSIEKSEVLSAKLTQAGIEHVILNARHEAEEAAIVARAGETRRVTVATNMAGRGTDIKLDPQVAQAGGLHVIGTELHESRRIDRQLIGRSARQGDPGSAQFLISIEDPLIRRYRKKRSDRMARRYCDRQLPLHGGGVRRFFRRVQRSIERQHRKMRSQLIKYDYERIKHNRELGTQ